MAWKKARKNLWVTKDGIPVKSYTGQMISYPYLTIGRGYYNSESRSKNTWKVTLVNYSSSKELKEVKAEKQAIAYAKKWMKKHPRG